jgi:predicted nucleotidyltransferase
MATTVTFDHGKAFVIWSRYTDFVSDKSVKPNIVLPVGAIAEVCSRYGVRELSVFGSVARGDFKPNSDIDLLVEFDPSAPIGFLALSALAEELTQILGRRVDLVPKGGLKAIIRDQVLSESEVIYAA